MHSIVSHRSRVFLFGICFVVSQTAFAQPTNLWTNNSNVGIGTTTPTALLDIEGDQAIYKSPPSPLVRILGRTSSFMPPVDLSGTTAGYLRPVFAVNLEDVSPPSPPLGSLSGSAFLITGRGAIGINTDNPRVRLDLRGPLRVGRDENHWIHMRFYGFRPEFRWTGDSTEAIRFGHVPNLHAPISQPVLALHPSGKVGIGTASPAQALELADGNIIIRGSDGFGTNGDEAILFLGDNNHYLKAIHGEGVRINTHTSAFVIG